MYFTHLRTTSAGRIAVFFYASLLLVMLLEYLSIRSLAYTQRLAAEQQSGWGIASEIGQQLAGLQGPEIEELLAKTKFVNPKIEIFILNPQGEILLSTRDGSHITPEGNIKAASIPLAAVNAALDHDPRFERSFPLYGPEPYEEGEIIFSAARAKIETQPVIVYVSLLSSAFRTIQRQSEAYYLQFGAGLALVSLFLIAAFVGAITFYRMSKRFTRFQRGVAQIAGGDLSHRLSVEGSDEVATLGQWVNQMADSLIRSLQGLQREGQLREEMIAALSHDFKSPLSSIRLRAERLLHRGESMSADERTAYMGSIISTSDRMSEFIGQTLQQFSGDFGTPKLTKSKVSPAKLIEQLVFAQLEPLSDAKSIALEYRSLGPAHDVYGDEKMLAQALYNLVDNAIHYSPPDSTVRVTSEVDNSTLKISVQDSGPGISEADQAHIFERFYRGEAAQRTVTSGTGLGLSIVRAIVEAHAGTVSVSSALGKGSTFTISLKIEPSP